MQKIKDLINKYYEGLAYLFFGGLATLLNLVVFAVFQAALGTAFATGIGNILGGRQPAGPPRRLCCGQCQAVGDGRQAVQPGDCDFVQLHFQQGADF